MSKEKQTLDPLVPNNEHSHTSVPNNEHSHIQVSQSDPQTYNLGRLDIDRAESSNLKEKQSDLIMIIIFLQLVGQTSWPI